MTDRITSLAGAACAVAGLVLLGQLDFSTMAGGGPAAVLAGGELGMAVLVVSLVLGLVWREW